MINQSHVLHPDYVKFKQFEHNTRVVYKKIIESGVLSSFHNAYQRFT